MVQSGKTIKKQLIATAKQELKEWLTMKKAMEKTRKKLYFKTSKTKGEKVSEILHMYFYLLVSNKS